MIIEGIPDKIKRDSNIYKYAIARQNGYTEQQSDKLFNLFLSDARPPLVNWKEMASILNNAESDSIEFVIFCI